jgi:fructose-specific phosphotransferase system IIC component
VITIYLCFLAGGAVLPFVSFIFGSLGDGIGTDVDTDIDLDTDVDMGTDVDTHVDINTGVSSMFSIGLFPSSLMSLSALAITFGAVGGIMSYTGKGDIITFVVAIIAGYIASVIVQTIIKTLKKVQKNSYGIDENVLLLYDGKVVDTILPGQLGTVSFTTLENVLVSFPARCTDGSIRLETGKIVKAIEIKNGIVIVEAKNKYE